MARVTHVAKARKDVGNCFKCSKPIKIGDSYKWFANRIGRSSIRKNCCFACRIRQSDLTTSEKLSRLYAAQEALEDSLQSTFDVTRKQEDGSNWTATTDRVTDKESFEVFRDMVAGELQTAADEANEVAQEYRDSLDNMPDGLRDADPNGLDDKAQSCEDWAAELENAVAQVESVEWEPDEEQQKDLLAYGEGLQEQIRDEADSASGSLSL